MGSFHGTLRRPSARPESMGLHTIGPSVTALAGSVAGPIVGGGFTLLEPKKRTQPGNVMLPDAVTADRAARTGRGGGWNALGWVSLGRERVRDSPSGRRSTRRL